MAEPEACNDTQGPSVSLTSVVDSTAPLEEEGKLFFDLDQGDLVETPDRGLFDLCPPPDSMIPKSSQGTEDEPLAYQEEAVSPRTFYNSFPQIDLRQATPQERSLEELLRGQHPEYPDITWKPQIRIPSLERPEFQNLRHDIQIKHGESCNLIMGSYCLITK